MNNEGQENNDNIRKGKTVGCHLTVEEIGLLDKRVEELDFKSRSEYIKTVLSNDISGDSPENDSVISNYNETIESQKKEITSLKMSNGKYVQSNKNLKMKVKELNTQVAELQQKLESNNSKPEVESQHSDINEDKKHSDKKGLKLANYNIDKLVNIENINIINSSEPIGGDHGNANNKSG